MLLHINQCIINNKYYKDKNKSAVQMSTMTRVWSSQSEGRLILYQVRPSVSWQLMISMRLLLIAKPCLPGKFDKLFLIFHNNICHVISFHFRVKFGVSRQDACCQPLDRITQNNGMEIYFICPYICSPLSGIWHVNSLWFFEKCSQESFRLINHFSQSVIVYYKTLIHEIVYW